MPSYKGLNQLPYLLFFILLKESGMKIGLYFEISVELQCTSSEHRVRYQRNRFIEFTCSLPSGWVLADVFWALRIELVTISAVLEPRSWNSMMY